MFVNSLYKIHSLYKIMNENTTISKPNNSKVGRLDRRVSFNILLLVVNKYI